MITMQLLFTGWGSLEFHFDSQSSRNSCAFSMGSLLHQFLWSQTFLKGPFILRFQNLNVGKPLGRVIYVIFSVSLNIKLHSRLWWSSIRRIYILPFLLSHLLCKATIKSTLRIYRNTFRSKEIWFHFHKYYKHLSMESATRKWNYAKITSSCLTTA